MNTRTFLSRCSYFVGAFCLSAGLLSLDVAAANNAPVATAGKRPRICLVLSGGGARGAAHVGVIKVLEEYRIPIDCIAGTSIGSLVGGAYATGMSVKEMEDVLAGLNTEVLFKEKPPRQELTLRRKADDRSILFSPEVGVKDGGLSLPKGVVSGVQLETVLRRLSKVPGYYDFDRLPIPFRAVATDLETGKAVIFNAGELANVMRASMSVPGAVAPAEFDGRMLVDGMLTSNLPVETARTMGADIIIAVNVGTPLLKREQLSSILGVTGQMLSILTEQNVQASIAQLKPSDILISPELGDFSTGDFDHMLKIAPTGEEAARKVAAQLAHLSVSPAEYAALRKRQQVTVIPDERPIDEIRFEPMKRVNPQAALGLMNTKTGELVNQQVLDQDMRRLYGTGDYEHVSYRYLEERGRTVLAVDAVEKSWGPDYLRFGLGLSSDFNSDASFNLLGSYRKTWINSLGAEWRTDLQLGSTRRFFSEFYQPLDADRYLFIAPYINLEQRLQNIYSGKNRIAQYDNASSIVGIDLGTQFGRYGELRLGVERGTIKPSLMTGDPSHLPSGGKNFDQAAVSAKLIIDQSDSPYFPRNGWGGTGKIYNARKDMGADVDYTKWDSRFSLARSFGEHTLNFSGRLGGKFGNKPLPTYDQFQWGGFLQQSGYGTGQLLGQDITYGRLMYYSRIAKGGLLDGAYTGVSFEVGKVGSPTVPGNSNDWLKSGAVFIGADSPIGPAYLGYGRAADGNSSFYFYLGNPF